MIEEFDKSFLSLYIVRMVINPIEKVEFPGASSDFSYLQGVRGDSRLTERGKDRGKRGNTG